ncbi:hypothetical protein Ais01nite_02670 [Asanoa ishikariensis]|nr:ricin-type beta-trefoil lectin domain protein [Asanoa ishikariensis]GIF62232.1 hypothetical protein Ais01nite_02670 [Asanoa ishikariensis]
MRNSAIDPAMPTNWPRWRFEVQNPADRSRWAMDAAFQGGPGTRVQLWEPNNGDAQLWYEEAAREGGVYLHPAYNRDLCLGVTGTQVGSPLLVQSCNGNALQRFHIVWGGRGGGMREIRSVVDGRCIDVSYSQYQPGTTLWLWGCRNFDAPQRWLRPAPNRDDGRTEPVLFVHGYDPAASPGYNCWGYFGNMINKFLEWGWTYNMRTVGYYAGDTQCDVRIASDTHNSGLYWLSQQFAWFIYDNYSSKHVSVDIVGHSMGGLIARGAVHYTRKGAGEDSSWPPYLFVEDVVTLGTPHDGSDLAGFCDVLLRDPECIDMRWGSGFVNGLSTAENPQSAQNTDWTTIGAEDDAVVSWQSAQGMQAGHRIRYFSQQGMCHDCLKSTTSGSFWMYNWNYHDGGPGNIQGGSPVSSTSNALHNYWRW